MNANNNSATWKNTTIPITHTATDVLYSGLNNPFTKYRFDNADCVGGGTVFSNGFINNYNTEGDHILYLCARDNAGNTQTWTGQYRIDTTQPYIVPGSVHYASLSTNGWTNSTNINISWSAADPMSGSPSGSSGLKNYDIAVYRTTSQNNPTALDHIITIPAATTTTNYTYPATNGYSYRFEIIPRDNA